MGNWRAGVFFIVALASVLLLLFGQTSKAYYSPIDNNPQVTIVNSNELVSNGDNQIVSCPGNSVKDIIGYGVDIIKLGDDISREDCLIMYSNTAPEIKTASLRAAKNRAIDACKDSIPKIDFTCKDERCLDCQKTIGATSCDDVHDNKIEVVSLAHSGSTGTCSMKSSASAWGKVSISCNSEVCAG